MECCGSVIKTDIGYYCSGCDNLIDDLMFVTESSNSSVNTRRSKFIGVLNTYEFPWYVYQSLVDGYEFVEVQIRLSGRTNLVNRNQLIIEMLNYMGYGEFASGIVGLRTKKSVIAVRNFVNDMYGSPSGVKCCRLEDMEFLCPKASTIVDPKCFNECHIYSSTNIMPVKKKPCGRGCTSCKSCKSKARIKLVKK